MASHHQPTIAASLIPNNVWPKASELVAESSPSVSLSDAIGDFTSTTEAVLLVATVRREFANANANNGGSIRHYWYGIYYCPAWKDGGLKRVNLTQSTKDYLTLNPEGVPAFCTYTEVATKKKKTYFKGCFRPINKTNQELMAQIKVAVPERVWWLAEKEHTPFSPEED